MSDDHLSDEELEIQIRAALHDPVPDDLIRISDGLFTWRTIDAELAELELSDSEQSAGVRGEDSTTLTFLIEDQVIEVELLVESGELVVDLGGDWASDVRLVTPDGGELVGDIDEVGVARFADPPTGPIQLIISRANGGAIKTRWVTL